MKHRSAQNGFVRAVKKFFLSAFVIFTFAAYALENHATAGGTSTAAAGPSTGRAPAPVAAAPAAGVTPTNAAPSTTNSGYKDGTYTGPAVDVNWGYVQVQATIQSGKLSNVQFLEYPSDRRTSVRINSVAVPELQQEAVQAQSANVNLITGATLTSEGFQESLQAALSQAQSQS